LHLIFNIDGAVIWDVGTPTPFGDAANDNAAFGEAVQTAGAFAQRLMFPGQYADAETGTDIVLSHNHHRTYDPTLGRYLSIDPVTFMDTGAPEMFNRYAYAINDPINHNDPTGEIPAIAACAAIPACRGAVGTVVGAVAGGVGAAISGDNILKGAGKGAVVGGVGAGTLSPAAATGTAGALGFADGAISSDSETLGGKVVDGAMQGVVEAGTTHLGGLAGGAVTGNLVKSEVVGNAASVVAGVAVSQGVNGAQALPGIASDAANSMGQAFQNGMQQLQDFSENPTGAPDFDRDDDF